jgi:rhodanese-related sulfurtransferase
MSALPGEGTCARTSLPDRGRGLMRQLLFSIPLVLGACSPQDRSRSLSPDAFEARLSGPGVMLIDTRTPAEYSSGHLANATNLDWNSGQLEAVSEGLEESKPVLLYCASGRRSAAAREFLIRKGFKDVKDLDGGIQAWTAEGKPVMR